MSAHDRIPVPAGRLMMVDIRGGELDAAQAEFLRRHQIRAVCLFRGNIQNPHQLWRLTTDLQRVMGPDALIAIDQEGGAVVRATFLPHPPSAMCLGAANEPELSRAVGAATARGLAAFGINWNFAPVVDINNNPANPVIAERSFGADAAAVVRHAGAWMDGALDAGVACCIKHFPGHGDTHVDSHFDLPVVDKPIAALEALELAPFAALARRAPAIMTAHIVYPALDPKRPATLSPIILNGLLRQRLGYDGVVITDSLLMQAIHARYGHAQAVVMALAAGADLVMALGTHDEQHAAWNAIHAAQQDGRLEPDALVRAAARIDTLARRFPLKPQDYPAATQADDDAMMREAWARGLSVVGTPRRPPRDQRIRLITQPDTPTNGVSEAGLGGAEMVRLFADWPQLEPLFIEDLPNAAPPPIDPTVFTVLASNHRRRYAQAGWKADLHLALWNPYQVFDVAAPTLLTWGHGAGAMVATRRWLAGEIEATASSPIPLGPFVLK